MTDSPSHVEPHRWCGFWNTSRPVRSTASSQRSARIHIFSPPTTVITKKSDHHRRGPLFPSSAELVVSRRSGVIPVRYHIAAQCNTRCSTFSPELPNHRRTAMRGACQHHVPSRCRHNSCPLFDCRGHHSFDVPLLGVTRTGAHYRIHEKFENKPGRSSIQTITIDDEFREAKG